jgi:8-oxo-dGTP pyrophosphatase MutT (NUDIX family)
MNKTIYYHNKKIKIISVLNELSETNALVFETEAKGFSIEKTIHTFLSSQEGQDVILLTHNAEKFIKLLKKQFIYIEAAGGLIEQNNRFLFIKRLGKWDLPKGKIEKGENPETAAIRECEEECGISDLTIKHKLKSTYHIYPFKLSFVLKKTYWFKMNTSFSEPLLPQSEEDIELAEWLTTTQIKEKVMVNTYPAISNLILENVMNSH